MFLDNHVSYFIGGPTLCNSSYNGKENKSHKFYSFDRTAGKRGILPKIVEWTKSIVSSVVQRNC
jgi:hypothetical protein